MFGIIAGEGDDGQIVKQLNNCEKKRMLAKFLKEIGIANDKFIGKIIIDIHKGGIRGLYRNDELLVD